ncbi:MAG: hypothetical protein AAGF79_14185 [Pseudomonadota bacterium]
MDKKQIELERAYKEARRVYLAARIRLLEHMLKTRRARRRHGPAPIELPGYDSR